MYRRLLLLALDWSRPKDPPFSLGQASILSALVDRKIDVVPKSWSVNQKGFDAEEVVQFVMQNSSPDVDVALGGFVWNEAATQHITRRLRQYNFPGRIILGGPQISYLKSGLEKLYPQVDMFIRGYGESAIAHLMMHYDAQTIIKGVHYAGQPDLGLTASVPLDELPSPYLQGVIKPQPFIRWETQRGCPFRCSFCQHREPDKSLLKRRHFPASRVSAESQWILDNPIINDVAVLDPTFNSGPDYLKTLQGLYGYRGKLALQCRMEMVTPEFLDAIDEINKTGRVVLEFGLQTIHHKEQKLIQRGNNMKKVDATLTEVRRRNIQSELSLIFGLPGQTVESFQQSIQYCIDKKVETIHAFPLMLLRGTLLHEKKKEWNLVESHEIASHEIPRIQDNIPHVVQSDTFSYYEWQQMAKIAEWLETDYNKRAG